MNRTRLRWPVAAVALALAVGCSEDSTAPAGSPSTVSVRAYVDADGTGTFTAGDVLIDSVHRFKGRAVPCVVFTEIDFEVLDEAAVRRIFVGATRATMKLTLVVSEAAARVLLDRMSR